jgi:hypothetical protein
MATVCKVSEKRKKILFSHLKIVCDKENRFQRRVFESRRQFLLRR